MDHDNSTTGLQDCDRPDSSSKVDAKNNRIDIEDDLETENDYQYYKLRYDLSRNSTTTSELIDNTDHDDNICDGVSDIPSIGYSPSSLPSITTSPSAVASIMPNIESTNNGKPSLVPKFSLSLGDSPRSVPRVTMSSAAVPNVTSSSESHKEDKIIHFQATVYFQMKSKHCQVDNLLVTS